MKYDLTAMTRRARNPRRRSITLRDIAPPAVLATNLYRAAYAPVVDHWSRTGDRLAAEYDRTLSALTTDSALDLQQILDDAGGFFPRLFLVLEPALRDWAVNVERWQRGKWRGAVLSATSIDIETLIGPEDTSETVGEYVAWNVALVKDVSAQAQKRMSDAVFAGVTERQPAREVAAKLREAVAMSRRRAIGIASDQTSKLTSALADERRREAGLSLWAWKHSGKLHPRSWHKERDGNLYSDDGERVGSVIDGVTLKAAPERSDLPGRPPWCGCRSQAVISFD